MKKAFYCFLYLWDVCRGVHGRLTVREAWGDIRAIYGTQWGHLPDEPKTVQWERGPWWY
jgi:hypothetical protein